MKLFDSSNYIGVINNFVRSKKISLEIFKEVLENIVDVINTNPENHKPLLLERWDNVNETFEIDIPYEMFNIIYLDIIKMYVRYGWDRRLFCKLEKVNLSVFIICMDLETTISKYSVTSDEVEESLSGRFFIN